MRIQILLVACARLLSLDFQICDKNSQTESLYQVTETPQSKDAKNEARRVHNDDPERKRPLWAREGLKGLEQSWLASGFISFS